MLTFTALPPVVAAAVPPELPVDVAPLLVDLVLLLLLVVVLSEFCWLTLLPLLAAF